MSIFAVICNNGDECYIIDLFKTKGEAIEYIQSENNKMEKGYFLDILQISNSSVNKIQEIIDEYKLKRFFDLLD